MGAWGECWALPFFWGGLAWGVVVIRELRHGDPISVGPYRLLGQLGAGGMGQVYLARSQGGRLVAIKVIRPELAQERGFRDRFAREIAAAKHVSALYTAAVVDSDPEAELPWMGTVYVPGPSLADAVNDDGPLPVKTVLALAAGLAEALAGMHRSGVVHRDLKPSNVLLAADGPRVIDFGISKAMERSMLTATGAVMGSPGYMSPEQARGQREVGKPTDVFSLGAVLAFAATGIGPFGSGSIPALLYRVVNEEPDLARVPARLRPLIERCLAKAPAYRPTPADIIEILSDNVSLPTGDWLPKTVADTIGRFSPATETPGHSPLVLEPPEPARVAGRADRDTGAAARSARDQVTSGPGTSEAEGGRPESVLTPSVANGAAAISTATEKAGLPGQRPADGVGRLRKLRWPFSAAAAVVVIAVPAGILVSSPGGASPLPKASHTVTASSSTTSAAVKAKNPAVASYASAPLATGSSLVRARVYFGQLKAVVGTLAGQVTFNTPAAWVNEEPGRCALTVVFTGVSNPTGAVYAQRLDSGWSALEHAPSQETEKDSLHQQIVTPEETMSAGESWQLSAKLIAGSLQLMSDTYSLQFQGTAGAAEAWLIDGHAVSCDG